ncbi:hypothetical protein BMAGN_1511 [Bifidobacterium magnum]|uniref:Uncharacterized protein n=1 Tax=Bifidobacterium magnum TaxID=1692 RepID=A0A087B9V7_9BIFI|nr:hypothetical protein BMAGN_1511 [Bifidobacterium magnum]
MGAREKGIFSPPNWQAKLVGRLPAKPEANGWEKATGNLLRGKTIAANSVVLYAFSIQLTTGVLNAL